jgi:hypothetical protein
LIVGRFISPDPQSIAGVYTQIEDEPPVDLVEQFSRRRLAYLLDQPLDLRPQVLFQLVRRKKTGGVGSANASIRTR